MGRSFGSTTTGRSCARPRRERPRPRPSPVRQAARAAAAATEEGTAARLPRAPVRPCEEARATVGEDRAAGLAAPSDCDLCRRDGGRRVARSRHRRPRGRRRRRLSRRRRRPCPWLGDPRNARRCVGGVAALVLPRGAGGPLPRRSLRRTTAPPRPLISHRRPGGGAAALRPRRRPPRRRQARRSRAEPPRRHHRDDGATIAAATADGLWVSLGDSSYGWLPYPHLTDSAAAPLWRDAAARCVGAPPPAARADGAAKGVWRRRTRHSLRHRRSALPPPPPRCRRRRRTLRSAAVSSVGWRSSRRRVRTSGSSEG